MGINPALMTELQPKPDVVTTFTEPIPPVPLMDWLEAESEKLQDEPGVIVRAKLVVDWISPAFARSGVVPGGPLTMRSQVAVPLKSVRTMPCGALHAAGGVKVGSSPLTIRTPM